ncbi:MAG: hypothetical protein Q4A21_00225 [bacterium]|nr:hypothetical protein [bacterium]
MNVFKKPLPSTSLNKIVNAIYEMKFEVIILYSFQDFFSKTGEINVYFEKEVPLSFYDDLFEKMDKLGFNCYEGNLDEFKIVNRMNEENNFMIFIKFRKDI